MDKQLTIVEFTPDSIKLLNGYYMKDKIKVLQSLEGEKLPLGENGLPKISDLRESLLTLVATARKQSKIDLGPLVVLYPPYGFAAVDVRESNMTGNTENRIMFDDFRTCSIRAMKVTPPLEKEALYFVPYSYRVDDASDLNEFPLNRISSSLEVEGDVHFINRNILSYYQDVVNSAGLKSSVYLQMISTYAGSYFVSMTESDSTYLLLELQPDYTYVTFVRNRHVISSDLINEGLAQVKKRYAQQLSISEERAMELISTFGFMKNLDFEYETDEGFTLLKLSNTLLKAFLPLFDRIQKVISVEESIKTDVPLILTGLGNGIFGIEYALEYYFKHHARIFKERAMGAEHGVYDASLGAIAIANKNYQLPRDSFRRSESDSQLKSTMFDR